MKKLFVSLVALAMAAMSYAQSTLVATLTHGDNIKMFYGAYALQQAHAAAAHGDIINLSAGAFQAVKITKALTIRGAGADGESTTYIINGFEIEIPTATTRRLSFEGVRLSNTTTVKGTLTNATFLKTIIDYISIDSDSKMTNGSFVNCRVYNVKYHGNSTAQFVNCEVGHFYGISSATQGATFLNCNIRPYKNSSYAGWNLMCFAQFINCILFNDECSNYSNLPSTSSAVNCVAVGPGNNFVFNDLAARQNCGAADFNIFQDGKGWCDLTDEAKAKYIGTDGTPVGMYGGMMPFGLIPTYPQITKMNVASKTSADGKLSVEIEVSATE